MKESEKIKLSTIYNGRDVRELWDAAQNSPVIDHPDLGAISPNKFRSLFAGKPCAFCAQKMPHGKDYYSTNSRAEAVRRGYQYKNKSREDYINRAGNQYFHPNYLTLDHKINKARCPELMFDFDNLQAMCWKCNNEKKDNNAPIQG